MSLLKGSKITPYRDSSPGSRQSDVSETDKAAMATFIETDHEPLVCRLCKHWKMFLVIIIPLLSMLLLSAFTLDRSSKILDTTSTAIKSVEKSFEISDLIQTLQQERGLSTSFLSTTQYSSYLFDKLESVRMKTNTSLLNVIAELTINNTKFTTDDLMLSLMLHRAEVNNRSITTQENLQYYTILTAALMRFNTQSMILPDDAATTKLLVTSASLLAMTDDVGIQRALGASFFSHCGWQSSEDEAYFERLHGRATSLYDVATYYQSTVEIEYERQQQLSGNLSYFVKNFESNQVFKDYLLICSSLSSTERVHFSSEWFSNMTILIDVFFNILDDTNLQIKDNLIALKHKAQIEFTLFLTTMIVSSLLSAVLSTWYIYCITIMTGNLSKYAQKIKEKKDELAKEKKRSDNLLYQMLPKKIANGLKIGQVFPAEHFDSVSIYFSDIVEFTKLAAESQPIEIVVMLNELYSLFDECIGKYDVYKVETIGDAYMVASGVPIPNGTLHASEIATMALQIRKEVSDYRIPHKPCKELQLRIGIHTGSCVAGIVGTKMPRYCLFGDTVNTASRMESSGVGGRIHISADVNSILQENGNFETEVRGSVDIKGKGTMVTYWLEKLKTESHSVVVIKI